MTECAPKWAHGASLEIVRRLGQALWMFVGAPIKKEDLLWTRGLLGDNGPQELFDELKRSGALVGTDQILSIRGLASFLCTLSPGNVSNSIRSRVVWTLPSVMTEFGPEEDTYCYAASEVIDAAKESLWLVSPFLESRGIGRILEALRRALSRDVHVQMITHGTESIADRASSAIEQLRREAVAVGGSLIVFTVKPDAGLLVHSKLVIADTNAAIVGSANLTDRGFGANFEAGVVLTDEYVLGMTTRIAQLLETGLVEQAFSTQKISATV